MSRHNSSDGGDRDTFSENLVDVLLEADRKTSAPHATVFRCRIWPLLRYSYTSQIEKGSRETPSDWSSDKAYLRQVFREWRFGRAIDHIEGKDDFKLLDRWLHTSNPVFGVGRKFWKLFLSWQNTRQTTQNDQARQDEQPGLVTRRKLLPIEKLATLNSIERLHRDKDARRQRFEDAVNEQLASIKLCGTTDFLFIVRPEEHFQELRTGAYAPIADSWIQVLSSFGHVQKITFARHKKKLSHPAHNFDPSIGHHLFPTPGTTDKSGSHVVIFPVFEYLNLQYLRWSLARIHPQLDFSPRRLIEQVYTLRKQRAAIRRLLAEIRPKAVFVTSFTGYPALMWACRDENIPVIDLQHGGMSPRHGIVSHYHKIPKNGYDLLPDQFWCWDQPTAKMINGWLRRGSQRHIAFNTGNAFWHSCQNGLIYDKLDQAERNFLSKLTGQKVVLVTLIYGESEFLPQIVRKAIKMAGRDVFWLIRMHGLNRNRGAEIEDILAGLEAHFDWAMATRLPLPMLFERSDVHVTQFSSSWREADKLGISTAFVDNKARNYFPDALTLPHNALCETANELRDFILRNCHRQTKSETAYAINHQQISHALNRANQTDDRTATKKS